MVWYGMGRDRTLKMRKWRQVTHKNGRGGDEGPKNGGEEINDKKWWVEMHGRRTGQNRNIVPSVCFWPKDDVIFLVSL